MLLTEDQILALAPDEASRKAGKSLAAPAGWVSAGNSARAIWGECRGSGAKPYQTIADTASLAFKCSCPSRKFPCKHGIGLMLYYTKDAAKFTAAEEPAWVSEWIGKRTQKATEKSEEKPVDTAAQAKRANAREDKVRDGLEELLLWMKDLLRGGLVQLPEKSAGFFDTASRRLIDAQAPGLARAVRELGDAKFFTEGWQTPVLDGFAKLYLAASGFSNLSGSSAAVLQDVRSFIGFPQSAEALQALPGVMDTWMVIGRRVEEEGPLTVEKYFLAGSTTGRAALILQYIARGAQAALVLSPGQCFEGELVYYPSASPLRAVIRSQSPVDEAPHIQKMGGWDEVAAAESLSLAASPFVAVRPYVLAALRPVHMAPDTWRLEDSTGKSMQLLPTLRDAWHWTAISGGDYLPTAVLGAEHIYEPLGVWHRNTYISLT